MPFRSNFPLSDLMFYKVGGPADIFFEPASITEIKTVMDQAYRHSVPMTLLGSGTNLLVRDGGIRGLTIYSGPGIKKSSKDIAITEETSHQVTLEASAHILKSELLMWALERNLSGLEFSTGIPGTLGGAVWMNAGTKWGSYSEVVKEVQLYSPQRGLEWKSSEEMGFKYRGHGEGLLDPFTLITRLKLELTKGKSRNEVESLVNEIAIYRGTRQPLELPNCGSVFKNPPEGKGAGRLIEAAGLKGMRIGNAMVSHQHANFILNLGGAKARDIENLILEVAHKVELHSGVKLEREVIILGET